MQSLHVTNLSPNIPSHYKPEMLSIKTGATE